MELIKSIIFSPFLLLVLVSGGCGGEGGGACGVACGVVCGVVCGGVCWILLRAQRETIKQSREMKGQPAKKIDPNVVIVLRHLKNHRGVLLEKRAAITKEIEELDAAILALE